MLSIAKTSPACASLLSAARPLLDCCNVAAVDSSGACGKIWLLFSYIAPDWPVKTPGSLLPKAVF